MSNASTPDDKLFAMLREYNHSLRNPLNTLSGTVELFDMGNYGELTPKQQRAVSRMQRNTKRMLALIEDMTIYAKAMQGGYTVNKKDIQLDVWFNEILEKTTPLIDEAGLEIELSELPDVTISSDPNILTTIVNHLLWNAIAESPDEGVIKIALSHQDNQLSLQVINKSKRVLPVDDIKTLYEPFWTGHKTHRRNVPSSGFGMGLSVVHSLTRVLNGSINITLDGTTFLVQITIST